MNLRLRQSDESGFTLIEAMAGVAVMAAVVASLGLIAGQWLPSWRHGFGGLQAAELLGLGLDRIASDVSAAEFITIDASANSPAFEGLPDSATFVRSAVGPNAPPGLEFVQIAELADSRGVQTVRASAPFAPGAVKPSFGNPVVLIKAPFSISFAYAGPDRRWVETWTNNPHLPAAVRVTVRDSRTGIVLGSSTATLIAVNAPPPTSEVEANSAPAPKPLTSAKGGSL